MENYAFVNEKIINGQKYKVMRSIIDPTDEILVIGNESIKVKVKEIWSDNEKIEKLKKDKKPKKK